jgi:hypothetical protein
VSVFLTGGQAASATQEENEPFAFLMPLCELASKNAAIKTRLAKLDLPELPFVVRLTAIRSLAI